MIYRIQRRMVGVQRYRLGRRGYQDEATSLYSIISLHLVIHELSQVETGDLGLLEGHSLVREERRSCSLPV